MAPCLFPAVCCSMGCPFWLLFLVCLTIIIVTGMVLFYLYVKNRMKKGTADQERFHEIVLKLMTFDHEKEWAHLKEVSASTDDVLKNSVTELTQKVSDLENELNTEKRKNELTGGLLTTYKEILEKLNVKVVPDDKKV